jgi:hypothetical protein
MTARPLYLAIALLAGAGCGGTMRSTDVYRADTQQLLAGRNAQVKSCYDAALATDPKLAGTVTVQFVVAKKTGEVQKVTLDPSAPPSLGQCVTQALQGLTLQPPDRNEGQATFQYAFQAPAAPAQSQ